MRSFWGLMLVFLVLLWATRVRSTPNPTLRSNPQVPCLFIFGDSLGDNGNNNRMLTLARANYLPYGIDFPGGITGRFSNGLTTVDVLAQLLGFSDFIPPYATTRGSAILQGLNYASGAAGIREETGINLGERITFTEQVENFGRTVRQMGRMFRGDSSRVSDYLSRCIYSVGMGSNDYLNNYFMPILYATSYEYSPRTYAALLLDDYSQQFMRLYELGARKVAVVNVGQIGCIPYELARLNNGNSNRRRKHNSTRCNETINKAILIFNKGLRKMVDRFNDELPGATFVYVNSYAISKKIVANAAAYGFEVIDKGCCGVGRNNGQITCLPFQRPCDDRTKYVFWDAFHPTEAANIILANQSYSSNSHSDVYPMNIRQLAMI